MADTYGLQDEPIPVQGDAKGLPLQPAIDGTKNLAAEFAKLVEIEGKALTVSRDREAMAKRAVESDRARLADDAKEIETFRAVRDAGEGWSNTMRGVSGVLQTFASGNILGGLQGAFGAMGQWGDSGVGKGVQGVQQAGGDTPGALRSLAEAAKGAASALRRVGGGKDDGKGEGAKGEGKGEASEGGGGFSRVKAVASAVAAVGQAIVSTLKGVSDVGQTVIGTLAGLASSASPAFGAAWTETTQYLMASIGTQIVPLMLPVAATIIMMADDIGNATKYVVESLMSLAGAARSAYNGFTATVANAAGAVGIGGGSMSTDYGATVIKEMEKNDKGEIVEKKQPDKQGGFAGAMRLFIDSMKTHSGQGGQPAFEGSEAAYKRIQQAGAGQTDLRRKTVELQQRMIDLLEVWLPKMPPQPKPTPAPDGA